MNEVVGLLIIAVGVFFDISGCVGLVRLPDVYNRIQASTKCVTVGTSFILAGSLVWLASTPGTIKGVLCIAFILLTSSTAAHALARAAHRSGVELCKENVADHYAEDMGTEGEKSGSAS